MGLDINPEVFRGFAFYGAVLIAKMIIMVPLTARQRFSKKIFANPEDISSLKGAKVLFTDPDVERVRRAHLNDLENILPFLLIGFLYCFTSPAVDTANLLFKVFTYSRIVHTFVYGVWPLPQPSRALAFFVGFGIMAYMTFKVMTHFA